MADNSIEVKISADASGFRAGAREAEAHSESLRSKLIELKGEHVQSARVARFYANEIADIVPGADAARESLQALVKVGLAEGAFGVALAGVGLLVAAFHEVSEAIDKTKEHFKKLEEDAKEYSKQIKEHVEDVLAAMEGQTTAELDARKKVLPLLAEETRLNGELAKVRAHLAEINEAVDENGMVGDIVGLNKATKEEIELQAQLANVRSKLGSARGGVGTIAGAESAQDEKKKSDAHREALRQMAIDDATWFGESLRAEKKHNDTITAETTKFLEEKFAAEEKEALDEARLLADETKEYKKHYDQVTADATATLEEMFRREEAEAKKLAHELGQAAKEMGTAMGQNLADVLKGTKSIEGALEDMLATLIKVATQMALMSALSAGGPLGILGGIGIGVIGSALGGLVGGGGGGGGSTVNHITISGSGLSSRQMETAVVNALRSAQRRGRF